MDKIVIIKREGFVDDFIYQLFLQVVNFIDIEVQDCRPVSFRCDVIDGKWVGALEYFII